MAQSGMSRRDFFQKSAPLSQSLSANESQRTANVPARPAPTVRLDPIAHPPNDAQLDLKSLPPLSEAIISVEELTQLIDDITQLGQQIFLVAQPGSAALRGETQQRQIRDQLQAAATSLQHGDLKRFQVRYCWQDSQWIDTLERRKEGIRLVRIQHTPVIRSIT